METAGDGDGDRWNDDGAHHSTLDQGPRQGSRYGIRRPPYAQAALAIWGLGLGVLCACGILFDWGKWNGCSNGTKSES